MTVRDSGRGITPDMLAHIFDMFVQADDTLDRREGGMGVGLTLVRSLVEMHGGTVAAHSEGEGQGSEFTVRLPLSLQKTKPLQIDRVSEPAERADAPSATEDTNRDRTAPQANVLLVEDNADARQMLRALLELDGHQVEVAGTGTAGLEALLRNRPDVALVDIGLPELDGYEIARRARKELNNGDLYLVALTGYGQKKDRAAVLEAGFDEHLVKPVNPQDLTRVLNRSRQVGVEKSC